MGMMGHGWGMMAAMFLFWALLLGGALWLLARLFPAAREPQQQDDASAAGSTDPAVQVVRRRYASGEITRAEYEDVLRTLGQNALSDTEVNV